VLPILKCHKERYSIVQLESQSKSQFTTQFTSDYHVVSNNSGNQTITVKISHCRIYHIILLKKKRTQRQITAVNTDINTISNSNKQSNQLHTYANKSNNTRIVYNGPHTD